MEDHHLGYITKMKKKKTGVEHKVPITHGYG
jgi:hypothetical protein